jgi:hypothetical protein
MEGFKWLQVSRKIRYAQREGFKVVKGALTGGTLRGKQLYIR